MQNFEYCNYSDKYKSFIENPHLGNLVRIFGGRTDFSSFDERLAYYEQFAEVWNYRKNQPHANTLRMERWDVREDDFVNEHRNEILREIVALGLTKDVVPTRDADYVVVLGSARKSIEKKTLLYKRLLDEGTIKSKAVILLCSDRQITAEEKQIISHFAPSASDEFQAFCCAAEHTFGVHSYKDTQCDETTILREYEYSINGVKIYVLKSCGNKGVRIKTKHSIIECLKLFPFTASSNILFISSQPAVLYQESVCARFFCRQNIGFECIGYGFESLEDYGHATKWLCEVQNTIHGIYRYFTE